MPTLALIGDVMLGRGVNAEIPRAPPEAFWGSVRPVLTSADLVIANLECAITRHRGPWQRTPKVFHFRADPPAVEVLRAGNVRCVCVANNHVLDFETEGLLETLELLDTAGIAHVGAGRDLDQAQKPATLQVAGLAVGVLGATDNEPPFAAGPERPGTNYLEIRTDPGSLARIEGPAAELRHAGASLVILSVHWGPNMVTVPARRFRKFAAQVLDRGIDVIHGHSAHAVQGVERRKGGLGLVLYDTGDILDDYAVDRVARNDWSFVFLLDLGTSGVIERLRMLPVKLDYASVELARGEEFEKIRRAMIERCRAVGTEVEETGEGLELAVGR